MTAGLVFRALFAALGRVALFCAVLLALIWGLGCAVGPRPRPPEAGLAAPAVGLEARDDVSGYLVVSNRIDQPVLATVRCGRTLIRGIALRPRGRAAYLRPSTEACSLVSWQVLR